MRELRFRNQIPGEVDPRRVKESDRSTSGAKVLAGAVLAAMALYLLETRPFSGAIATVEPQRVEFEGTGSSRPVTITSTGDAPLRIHSVTVRGRNASDFSVVGERCAHEYMLHGQSCSIDLEFHGSEQEQGELVVTGNAEDGPLLVELIGMSQKPMQPPDHPGPDNPAPASSLVAHPPSLDLGRVRVAGAGQEQFVRLSVNGASPVSIDRILTRPGGEFRVATDSCSHRTLGQGESCQLGMVFVPTAAGPRAARLEVVPLLPSEPLRVELSGTGIRQPDLEQPDLDMYPSPLVFSSTRQGSRSEREIRVTSHQTTRFSKATISGANQIEFSIVSDGCKDKPLSAGESCRIRVRFAPRDAGERSATLTLGSRVGSPERSPSTIELRGEGVGRSAIALDPPSLSFVVDRLGMTSPPQAVTVTKSGPGSLTIESISVLEGGGLGRDLASILGGGNPSQDFTASQNCVGKILDPAGRCEIAVRFVPKASGERHAFLAVKPSGATVPVTVRLEGAGPVEAKGWCCVGGDHLSAETAGDCERMRGRYYPPDQLVDARRQCVVIK